MLVVSWLTPSPRAEQIQGLTYATTLAEDKASSRATWNWKDVLLSVIVIGVIIFTLVYFSPLNF